MSPSLSLPSERGSLEPAPPLKYHHRLRRCVSHPQVHPHRGLSFQTEKRVFTGRSGRAATVVAGWFVYGRPFGRTARTASGQVESWDGPTN